MWPATPAAAAAGTCVVTSTPIDYDTGTDAIASSPACAFANSIQLIHSGKELPCVALHLVEKQAGFTLIELSIVLVIIGLIAGGILVRAGT